MKKFLLYPFLLLMLVGYFAAAHAQLAKIQPAGASIDDRITVIFDATQGNKELMGASKVYMHSGVVTTNPMDSAWSYVVGNWGQDNGVGEMTRMPGETNKWQITLSPTARQYYKVPEGTKAYKLALVFRSANGSQKGTIAPGTYDWGTVTQNRDIYLTLNAGAFVNITAPTAEQVYVPAGGSFPIKAEASGDVSSMIIYVKENGAFVEKHRVSSGKTIEYNYSPASTERLEIKVVATIAGETVERSSTVNVAVRTANVVEALPAGIKKGINYHAEDPTKVTLVLEAPGKGFAYVVGDFTDWAAKDAYQMKQTPDGELFWLEVSGLTANREYVFQYWIDENIHVGDPYAEKVADPWNDRYIPASVYPNLPAYNKESYGVASVLQTGQAPYQWAATEQNWTKPAKEELVIYEVLLRDFLASHSYKDLTDTLSYLKRLGVNAIELMPVMEFEGNNSWGYNPMYFFAPDKYYGTNNDLKRFIEAAHQQGMAVILDMVLNHAFGLNPMVKMYWDPAANTVSANSPWFNPQATHPFNVGFDFNHESPYTQSFVDSVNRYWIEEYHFDGYRFDLSKGFTQKNNPNDVGAWSAYDSSRVALLKRMSDKIWTHSPDAYVILEHFADNREEKELAEYRAAEGKGMLLWGNLNHAYNQNTMGYSSESNVNWVYHGTRNWATPHVVGYMESHDEERLMRKNIAYGNAAGTYNVKNLATALQRQEAANVIFYTIPGPKMLWQFGELGFEHSINRCEDGTIDNNCRLSPKPITWNYLQEPNRVALFNHTADIIKLRNTYDVFTSGTVSFSGSNTLLKQIGLKNQPYVTSPANADEMNAQVVTNFDVQAQNVSVSFPHTGTWYDYYDGGKAIEVTSTPFTVSLPAGAYKLYTDYPIGGAVLASATPATVSPITVFPNPAENTLHFTGNEKPIQQVILRNVHGAMIAPVRVSGDQWDISHLKAGFYVVEIHTGGQVYYSKLIKK